MLRIIRLDFIEGIYKNNISSEEWLLLVEGFEKDKWYSKKIKCFLIMKNVHLIQLFFHEGRNLGELYELWRNQNDMKIVDKGQVS